MSQHENLHETSIQNGRGSVTDRAKEALSDATDAARQQTETLRASVKDTWEDGSEQLSAAASQTANHMRDNAQMATDLVRRNPGLAMVGALGLGVLVGLAVSRRS
ncbi:YqjD family protein [Cognatishimia sp. F0-27]|uniref:DUF883 family protein n=1 Tax=Cognatishimia sp. F0-27 TaxID=2816855 RepID=UPI001D0C7288|nr:hypothetical protein [Cognatishimia sp. F0-27]MCC1493875.1 DUF883 family protein [Cognatishimia sp. F0-27]